MATKCSKSIFWDATGIAPLVTFRIGFGLLMFFSLIRFWWRGWVTTAYIQPKFHFTYMGFGWVRPFGEMGTHLLFGIVALSALLIAVGLFYRVATIVFFTGFTYIELIDVTTYLNHYYFISLIAFLLIFIPAQKDYSLDVKLGFSNRQKMVPAWTMNILRFQLAVVYFFAGLAKLNSDWLLNALPMKIWLPAKSHLPIVGPFMYQTWVAYLFSWFGAAYDLLIVFFLLNKKTRSIAYLFVLIFHGATSLFFPAIGMFPYVMMVSSLIFFSADFHEKFLSILPNYEKVQADNQSFTNTFSSKRSTALKTSICLFVVVQILIPLRFLAYPGHLFWHEEGYRFSWRVMLMEKAGAAYFTVKDSNGTQRFEVDNKKYLTPLQEKMMSTQPDMIVKYAHYLANEYHKMGVHQPQVFAEVYVTLNGQPSTLFIDSTVNLAAQKTGWNHYNWVLPYPNNITE
jgi:hypothetical protein